MNLKKKYIHNNNRQIFRLIPTDTDKIIIEERDTNEKQAYFNCLYIESGKKILKNLQLDEKFWVGIEAVYNDVIFFHKFQKPDMPHHRGIIAYDIEKKKKIWENLENTFLFIKDDKVYSFQQNFDGREFFTLNYTTGEMIEELGNDSSSINLLREKVIASEDFSAYIFPTIFDSSEVINQDVNEWLIKLKENHLISGKIEFALKDNLLMFNFHEINADNSLNNKFKAVDLLKGKYIFETTLNFSTNAFVPDSFFVKDNLLFLLIERKKLGVYNIIN
ncbi:MAG: DUF4905 domain-containing protein [Ignavibacteria bacterium]|nr:DUF4905 domain-containing protein [Ignavibacteria bacterium]